MSTSSLIRAIVVVILLISSVDAGYIHKGHWLSTLMLMFSLSYLWIV